MNEWELRYKAFLAQLTDVDANAGEQMVRSAYELARTTNMTVGAAMDSVFEATRRSKKLLVCPDCGHRRNILARANTTAK